MGACRIRLVSAVLATLSAVGCFNPMTTRLPQVAPRDPRVEMKSMERYDPFPDPDLGPDTQVRPRGFETERTMPRRNYEDRIMQGRQREYGAPAYPPATGWRYPQSLQ